MRHYHGTPLGGTRDSVARFVSAGRRHFLIPFGRQEDLPIVAESACGMVFDNGAFTAWKQGQPITNWEPYYRWCLEWWQHPRFDFAIIPDVIDGTEDDNDALFAQWFRRCKTSRGFVEGAPVWHLHESFRRLEYLTRHCKYLCLGSSGEFATVGTDAWIHRMDEAMEVVCDSDGKPLVKLHGLRMLDPFVLQRYPLASADSTNVAQNSQLTKRFGMYCPPSQSQRREVIAARIESVQTPAVWVRERQTESIFEECI